MNEILQLRGEFQQRPSKGGGGTPKIPKQIKSATVESKHLNQLLKKLKSIREYWSYQKIISGVLLDVHHIKVMAKSNRIGNVFMQNQDNKPANDFIVGARFSIDENQDRKHVITYYIDDDIMKNMIAGLESCIQLLNSRFNGKITRDGLDKLSSDKSKQSNKGASYDPSLEVSWAKDGISLSTFRNIIVDSFYIENFDIPNNKAEARDQFIITIYKTDVKAGEIMKKIGIDVPAERIIGDTTMLLDPPQVATLRDRAPYLIAMATEDTSKQSPYEIFDTSVSGSKATIPDPTNEPIVGVIDTMFDQKVYFAQWVEFRKMISEDIPLQPADFEHGTSVSSIIVDGPVLNPSLDDGCGRFRVRHFGVAAGGKYSASKIIKLIKFIVADNPDIRVWNLSLGSNNEVNSNSISYEASVLDEIQFEQDVIFIIAGTNKVNSTKDQRIGAPADSVNSITVNSVNSSEQPASYSRRGRVLSFFNKPDVSSYGGDKDTKDFIRTCSSSGETLMTGTSFAAPWVTRKMAYLIEVLGFSREVAKALIIDASAGWSEQGSRDVSPVLGYGVVPIRIEDILQSSSDEIKFVISGVSDQYDTYNFKLPVPIDNNDKYPFVVKATLCYFPKCSINQGVDYTNTELDLYIGRVVGNQQGQTASIRSVNKNPQSSDNSNKKKYMYERDARGDYRKWDNTKHICEPDNGRARAKKVYTDSTAPLKGNRMWGISLKTKERLIDKDGSGIKFGIVVTLKEITGVNRIDDFVRNCLFNGWLVNKVDITDKIEIYKKMQEDVEFDGS